MNNNAVIEECERGHTFAKLPDHPRRDGLSRCPHCMAEGLDKLRERNFENVLTAITDLIGKGFDEYTVRRCWEAAMRAGQKEGFS